jgi:hypothetical protein
VAAVILTGGTSTALTMLAAKPDLRLAAETGGKNATIVTAMSDRELAIKHVVHSAFGHSGQKCSATSLLLLEAEVYDDPAFRRTLCDAVRSLHVDSAHVLHARKRRVEILVYAAEKECGPWKSEPWRGWPSRPAARGQPGCGGGRPMGGTRGERSQWAGRMVRPARRQRDARAVAAPPRA